MMRPGGVGIGRERRILTNLLTNLLTFTSRVRNNQPRRTIPTTYDTVTLPWPWPPPTPVTPMNRNPQPFKATVTATAEQTRLWLPPSCIFLDYQVVGGRILSPSHSRDSPPFNLLRRANILYPGQPTVSGRSPRLSHSGKAISSQQFLPNTHLH
ncbi:hypothetical protein GQ44DRAFT_505277 [Phaeosphaeriaceae sp. PMI808]|nr:hypothetical protein GQ44DRAFT_505277 [Phaeosphaeriaceae sp. PMI808]